MITKTRKTAVKTVPAKAKAAPKADKQEQAMDTNTSKQGADTAGKTRRRKTTTQQQATTPVEKQGAGTAGEMRGGSKQVLITEDVMNGKTGRPLIAEEYPFDTLGASRLSDDGRSIVGPSFFIPESDKATARLATARKRYGLFWSRKRTEKVDDKSPPVPGLRIWRGSKELEDISKR